MQGNRTLLTGSLASAPGLDEPPVFYSVPKAARYLGISPATLYRAISAGEFPAIKVRGRLRVLADVLDDILAASRAGQMVDVAVWFATRRDRTASAPPALAPEPGRSGEPRGASVVERSGGEAA